jgi:hypothetical protein
MMLSSFFSTIGILNGSYSLAISTYAWLLMLGIFSAGVYYLGGV